MITVIWVVVAFGYYMIGLQVKYFPGSFTQNTLTLATIDCFTPFIVPLFLHVTSMRPIFLACFTVQASFCTAILIFIDPETTGATFLVLIAFVRIGIQAAFVLVWVEHPKMMPTLFAATSMGISNFVARTVVVLAPLVAEIGFYTPILIFCVMATLGIICSYFLIERPQIKEESTEMVQRKDN